MARSGRRPALAPPLQSGSGRRRRKTNEIVSPHLIWGIMAPLECVEGLRSPLLSLKSLLGMRGSENPTGISLLASLWAVQPKAL